MNLIQPSDAQKIKWFLIDFFKDSYKHFEKPRNEITLQEVSDYVEEWMLKAGFDPNE